MSDTSEIDESVIAKLADDATLYGLMGTASSPEQPFVFWDVAPPGLTKFVIVSLVIGEDNYSMREAAYEKKLYTVKAVQKTKTGAAVIKPAAARIQALLHDQALTIDGYRHMHTRRTEPVRFTEVDDDTDERWLHRGGRYEVWAAPTN